MTLEELLEEHAPPCARSTPAHCLKQSLKYVIPSVPQTGAKTSGQVQMLDDDECMALLDCNEELRLLLLGNEKLLLLEDELRLLLLGNEKLLRLEEELRLLLLGNEKLLLLEEELLLLLLEEELLLLLLEEELRLLLLGNEKLLRELKKWNATLKFCMFPPVLSSRAMSSIRCGNSMALACQGRIRKTAIKRESTRYTIPCC